jgi:hypothetical protein
VTKEKLVLSPAAAADLDRQKKRRKIEKRLIGLGLDREEYEAAAEDLRGQFGVAEPDPGDVFWQLANNLQLQQEQAGKWSEAARTWRAMAQHLRDKKRDPNLCLVAMFRNELRYRADLAIPGSISGALPNVTISAHGGCEVCGADDGRSIAITEAQEQMPLPHEGCSKGFCGCSYRSIYPAEEARTRSDEPKTGFVKRLLGRG